MYDLEEVPAGPPHPDGARYLLVHAQAQYTHVPGLHDIFTILMRYQRPGGDQDANWPAHIMPGDADTVGQRFQAFMEKNAR